MKILRYFEKEKFIFLNKEFIINTLLLIIVFLFDRVSKIKIIEHQLNNNRVYVNDFINLDLVWNTGIGFGLLSSKSTILYNLITLVIGTVIVILFIVFFKSDNYEKFIFTIIIGGALGNFYDRLYFRAVPDFIDIHYGNFHWFTFNVADIFITLGIIIFLLKNFVK
mgnify:CR=1 FL=1